MARDPSPLTEDQIKRIQQKLRERSQEFIHDISYVSARSESELVELVESIDLEVPDELEFEPVSELEEDLTTGTESESDDIGSDTDSINESSGDVNHSAQSPVSGPGSGGRRAFALRTEGGTETSVFSGGTPRQAALKAARRLNPANSEDDADPVEIRLREKGTHKVHIYEGWAWEEEAPADSPKWMPEEITKGNVSKEGVEHLDEI